MPGREGRRWAVLDFETASFLEPRVIEVGLVGSDGAVLLESLVDPRIPITEQVTGIHGLTNADVDGAPAWPSVQRELARVLEAHGIEVLVAFNASFEAMCLAYNAEAYGIEGLDVELVCVQRVAVGLLGPGENGRLSLQAACARVGVDDLPTHRAVADCVATAALTMDLSPELQGDSEGRERRERRASAAAQYCVLPAGVHNPASDCPLAGGPWRRSCASRTADRVPG